MPVFDCEGDSLTPTKIHCLSYENEDGSVSSLTSYADMSEWLLSQSELIGHNIILFDIPVLERILNIKIKAKLIDTLALSWYLFPERQRHGLEWWGVDLGIPKPPIADWENLTIEEYIHRCEEDVKINGLLWRKQRSYLDQLYPDVSGKLDSNSLPDWRRIVSYLSFKLDCAREQERSRWKLDKDWCKAVLEKLSSEQQPRIDALKRVMPNVVKKTIKQYPAKPFKKDGTLSVEGVKWQKYLSEQGLTKDHKDPIYILDKEEPPNPNSPEQLKDWLFSLGWKPETFKFVKEDDGSERKIPQIKIPNSPDICPSVLELAEKEPAVKELEELSIVRHRLGILQGFLDNADEEGFLKARIQGFTNTLRFKHTEIVNLPGVDKPYGKEVRGCLVARDGFEVVGTDMVSLESTTKKHYMWPHDPEYVEEMSVPGFDEHLDLAVKAKALTKDQMEAHKAKKEDHSRIRKQFKAVNYSGIYGVGPPKLARELKSTVAFAKQLLKAYWDRNWSVKKVAEDCIVKTVNGQKWLFNPVSKFWYSLRNEKDRFSTLNQGTGVYCFDSFVGECRKRRPQITAQFHDETISEVKKGFADKLIALQREAINAVNDRLKLNVKLDIDSHVGYRYSDIH